MVGELRRAEREDKDVGKVVEV